MSRDTVEVVPYDPRWSTLYEAEQQNILQVIPRAIVIIEHIGSTAVPGLQAKPIIDIMAAIPSLSQIAPLVAALEKNGYQVIETGMPRRVFLRRQEPTSGQVYHLHIVEYNTWDQRKERLMRDYLLTNPDQAEAYGALKDTLAETHRNDSFAYTKAKTDFIQGIMDQVHDARNLPCINVWESE